MTGVVVDTNVAMAANGRGTHADPACRMACVARLRAVVESEIVVVDEHGLIFAEYAKRLRWAGAPGMGDAFFKHLFDNQYRAERCLRVPVVPLDDRRGFEELPPNSFDPSDQKFLAVAVVGRATVLNATDSDWAEHAALVNGLAVKVEQLCPQHAAKHCGEGR